MKERGLTEILQVSWESRNREKGVEQSDAFAIPAINFYDQNQLRAIVAASQNTRAPIVAQACAEYVRRQGGNSGKNDDMRIKALVRGFQKYERELTDIASDSHIYLTGSNFPTVDIPDVSDARIILALDHYDIPDLDRADYHIKELTAVLEKTNVGLIRVNAAGFLPPDRKHESIPLMKQIVQLASKYGVAVEGVYSDIDAEVGGEKLIVEVDYKALNQWRADIGLTFVNYDMGTFHGSKKDTAAPVDVDRVRNYQEGLNNSGLESYFLMHGGSSVATPGNPQYDQQLIKDFLGFVGVVNIATNTSQADRADSAKLNAIEGKKGRKGWKADRPLIPFQEYMTMIESYVSELQSHNAPMVNNSS